MVLTRTQSALQDLTNRAATSGAASSVGEDQGAAPPSCCHPHQPPLPPPSPPQQPPPLPTPLPTLPLPTPVRDLLPPEKGQLSSEPYWFRNLPQPAWLRLFHRQLDRDAVAKAHAHTFFYAAEKLGGGNYYGSAPSLRVFIDEFYSHCLAAAAAKQSSATSARGTTPPAAARPVELHIYEQIPGWLPCKLYFDVGEWNLSLSLRRSLVVPFPLPAI